MFRDYFPGDSDASWREIPSEPELKTKEQLLVELPGGNADFHSLAMDLIKTLPREAALPQDLVTAKNGSKLAGWHCTDRPTRITAQPERLAQEETNGVKATFWRLKLAGL